MDVLINLSEDCRALAEGIGDLLRWRGKPMPQKEDPAPRAGRELGTPLFLVGIHDQDEIRTQSDFRRHLSTPMGGNIVPMFQHEPSGLEIWWRTHKRTQPC